MPHKYERLQGDEEARSAVPSLSPSPESSESCSDTLCEDLLTRGGGQGSQAASAARSAEAGTTSTPTHADSADRHEPGAACAPPSTSACDGNMEDGTAADASECADDAGRELTSLRVKAYDETTVELDVDIMTITAEELKSLVADRHERFVPDRHRLVFQGRVLSDEVLLATAGVRDGHTLLLFPRPAKDTSVRCTRSNASSSGNSEVGDAHRDGADGPFHTPDVAAARMLRMLAQLQAQRDLEAGMAGMERTQGEWREQEQPVRPEGTPAHWLLGFAFALLFGWWAVLCLLSPLNPRALNAGCAAGLLAYMMMRAMLELALLSQSHGSLG